MSDCVLGIDGGGTKTHAQALDLAGQAIGQGTAGPCTLSALSVDQAMQSIHTASAAALAAAGRGFGDVRSLSVGAAGWSHRERRAGLEKELHQVFPRAAVSVVPDYVAALAGATEGKPGIIVISGTGSAAYGKNAFGQSHRAGAYGYLIDDAGSGYGVGRAALAAVMKEADGTGEPTALTRRLLAAAHLAAVTDLVPAVYGGPLDRVAIAALAPLVAEAATIDQDMVAQKILMRTGGALAQLTAAVVSQLFAQATDPFPVALVGSLWKSGAHMTDVFSRSLSRCSPLAVVCSPSLPPEHGAALQALKAFRND